MNQKGDANNCHGKMRSCLPILVLIKLNWHMFCNQSTDLWSSPCLNIQGKKNYLLKYKLPISFEMSKKRVSDSLSTHLRTFAQVYKFSSKSAWCSLSG